MVLVGPFQCRVFCDSVKYKDQMLPRMLCTGASSGCVYLGRQWETAQPGLCALGLSIPPEPDNLSRKGIMS